jgi:antitoxin VapB
MSRARAKIFANGGSQAVRLPKEFRFDAQEVEVWRVGDEIRLRPVPTKQMWQEIFAKIDETFKGEFPDRDQPEMPPSRPIFDD